MNRKFKEKYIKRWFNIGGPMGGATKTVKSLLGGYKDLYIDFFNLGLKFEDQIGLLKTTGSIGEVLPSGIWFT